MVFPLANCRFFMMFAHIFAEKPCQSRTFCFILPRKQKKAITDMTAQQSFSFYFYYYFAANVKRDGVCQM